MGTIRNSYKILDNIWKKVLVKSWPVLLGVVHTYLKGWRVGMVPFSSSWQRTIIVHSIWNKRPFLKVCERRGKMPHIANRCLSFYSCGLIWLTDPEVWVFFLTEQILQLLNGSWHYSGRRHPYWILEYHQIQNYKKIKKRKKFNSQKFQSQ